MSVVVGLTFLFGLGNVWLLALRLGVPGYVAPLVAPAVDLSVLGLLVAIRELVVRGAPVREVRAARRLLLFASVVTLALNVAEPALAGNPGKAAFDAVGPLLLIGCAAATITDTPKDGEAEPRAASRGETDREAREQDLFHRARAEDVLHWQEYHRPIAAETLAKRLHVGSRKARKLVTRLRSDTHGTLDSQAPAQEAVGPVPAV